MAGLSRDPIPHGWVEIGRIPFGLNANIASQGIAVLLLGAIVALSEIALPSRGLVEVYQTTRHAALIFLGVMLATARASRVGSRCTRSADSSPLRSGHRCCSR